MKDYVEKVYQLIGIYKQSLISNPMCKSVDCFYPEGTEEKASEYYSLTDIILKLSGLIILKVLRKYKTYDRTTNTLRMIRIFNVNFLLSSLISI